MGNLIDCGNRLHMQEDVGQYMAESVSVTGVSRLAQSRANPRATATGSKRVVNRHVQADTREYE